MYCTIKHPPGSNAHVKDARLLLRHPKQTMSLKSVNFSILNAGEIRAASVCEVFEKRTADKGIPLKNGLRDPRMGPAQGICVTCGLRQGACHGHFGHIELCEPFYHISWALSLVHWLKLTCKDCGTFVGKKIDVECARSRYLQTLVKKLHSKCPSCETRPSKYSWSRDTQKITANGENYDTSDVLAHLDKIHASTLKTLKMSHPKNMLLEVIPVPPPNVRPAIMAGDAVRGEDDLTYRLLQVIRSNAKLKSMKDDSRPEHIIASAREATQLAISGYFNHRKVGSAKKRSSTREYASVASRLTQKEGRMRGNLMGKRCDFTARSVITGDDTLSMKEVGVPISVAKKLTIPVKVTDYNRASLQELLDGDSVKFVVRPNGSRVDLSFINKATIKLDTGYTVERCLRDGDIVLFNRQPSLHKMSLMAHEVRVLPYSTFRMNLSCTTPYNADCK